MQSLQDTYAKENKCFGCGPKNEKGLQIKSYVDGDKIVAKFYPKEFHQAFPNCLSGGICGTILDCHSNWTAAYHIMNYRKEQTPPCTVTASYTVDLLLPTPMNTELLIEAFLEEGNEKKASVKAHIKAQDKVTAKCEGLFVAVNPGHPAYHRW